MAKRKSTPIEPRRRAVIPLRIARKIRGLTQKQLADAAGVDFSFISLLETGGCDITATGYDVVTLIARALNLTADELIAIMVERDHGIDSESEAHHAIGGQS